MVLSLLAGGCGYHLVGKGAGLPTHVRSIGVPIFINYTQRYELEQKLTRSVLDELVTRVDFAISSDSSGVDAVIRGEILSFNVQPVTFSNQGRANQFTVMIIARVVFTDEINEKTIYENPRYLFRGDYEINEDINNVFNQQSGAIDDIAEDFASSVVSTILEGF